MSLSRNLSVLLLGAGVLISGCSSGGAPEDVQFDDPSYVPLVMGEPISTNGMNPVDFWDLTNQAALRSLATAPLRGLGGNLVSTPLLNTAGGRSVLAYTLRCALNDNQTLTSSLGYSFTGDLNLAPAWTTRALTTSEQRWVTACLLDHLNGLGASVPIALVGNNPALVPDPGEDSSSFTIREVTAFGNIFVSSPKAYYCEEVGLNLACGVSASTYTLERICGLSPTCGATHLGLCALVCSYDAAGNPSCTVPLGPTYAESIETMLQQTVAISLYPLCGFL